VVFEEFHEYFYPVYFQLMRGYCAFTTPFPVFVGQMSGEWRQRAETDFCVRESVAGYQTEAGRDAVY